MVIAPTNPGDSLRHHNNVQCKCALKLRNHHEIENHRSAPVPAARDCADRVEVPDQDLDDGVAELDVDDGGHGLLLGPQQGRPETHGQVTHRHQVLVALTTHAAAHTCTSCSDVRDSVPGFRGGGGGGGYVRHFPDGRCCHRRATVLRWGGCRAGRTETDSAQAAVATVTGQPWWPSPGSPGGRHRAALVAVTGQGRRTVTQANQQRKLASTAARLFPATSQLT